MPSVIVKLAKHEVLTPAQRRSLGPELQRIVAEVLSVPGTQAELWANEVEVDYVVAGPDARMNGRDMVITVEANQYPERTGRAQEFSDSIKKSLKGTIIFPTRWNVWVRLAEGGWS